jgi:dTDP-4-amino-4,6-dideoxygalactose transaminase
MTVTELAIKGGPRTVPEGTIQPWPWITEEDKKAVMEALERATPWRYPYEEITGLEADWAAFVGVKHALACNSGTASLHMCVAAAGVGPGDEVLVPAFTFLASASCVLHSNGIPIFVDIEPETCTIDPSKIEERITDRTKAIVAVDIHGVPCSYDEIHEIAARYGLYVIEDGAQAHGSIYKGRQVGSLGHMAGCSLNGSKNLSALAEGGLFTTDDDRLAELAARVRMFGEVVRPGEPRRYNAYMMGWNYRTDPLQAAFARSQLRRLPELTAARQRNCEHLTSRIKDLPSVRVQQVPPDRTHSYFFYPFRVQPYKDGIDVPVWAFRDALAEALQAEGVPAQRWQPHLVPEQTLFQFRDAYGKGCPWSCPFARQGITYDAAEYPEARRLVEEALYIGHSTGGLGPPNDLTLMNLYADAFEKVLVGHLDELVALALEKVQAAG